MILTVVATSFLIGYIFDDTMKGFNLIIDSVKVNFGVNNKEVYPEMQTIINNCKEFIDVETFSFCLRDSIKPFYIYNITEDKLELTFEELKIRGGDCEDWSNFYKELAIESGFNATIQNYEGILNVGYGHQWVVIHDNKFNCRLDLLNVLCSENVATIIN